MTKFEQKSFSTPANSQAYVDNWDRVFGKPVCETCKGEGQVVLGLVDVTFVDCPTCKPTGR